MKYLGSAPIVFGPPKGGWAKEYKQYAKFEKLPEPLHSQVMELFVCSHPNQVYVHGRWECQRCGALIDAVQS